MALLFLPRSPPRPLKRGRPVADIDGEHSCTQKKKRRLRLFLITSRLSPQFSYPATNIVDRGSSKVAVWAKQKSLARNLLRKAAILNRIRRRTVCSREAEDGQGRLQGRFLVEQERELELARLEFNQGSVDTYTRPTRPVPSIAAVRIESRTVVPRSPSRSPSSSRSSCPTLTSPPVAGQPGNDFTEYRSPNEGYAYSQPRAQLPRRGCLPLPPSPLGLSNYDAFDLDEDVPNPYSHFDDDDDESGAFTGSFHHEDDDDVVPFSPLAVTSPSSPTLRAMVNEDPQASPPTFQEDYSSLEPNESVFGDYDQVDDGADAVWPSNFAKAAMQPTAGSTSADFEALITTAAPKRIDSFAAPSTSRPNLSWNEAKSTPISPDFAPTITSPNFVPIRFSPSNASTAPSMSPNFVAASVSPNFSAVDAPSYYIDSLSQRPLSLPAQIRPGSLTRTETDLDLERRRQRNLMFMHFGA